MDISYEEFANTCIGWKQVAEMAAKRPSTTESATILVLEPVHPSYYNPVNV